MSLSVLLAGGGTAGHVAPLLALADCLRRRDPQTAVTVLGTAEGLESRLVPEAGYPLEIVPKVPMPRRPSAALGRLPASLRAAVRAAESAMEKSGAQVVVGFGGYVSTPAYLAARRRGVPIVVHEQNARPGLANRLGAMLTSHVAVTFPGTPLRGAQLVGLPLRRLVTQLHREELRAEAMAAFGLDPNARTLFVTGGSLGAQRLNVATTGAAQALADAGVQVIHAAGRGKVIDAQRQAEGAPVYLAFEYLDRMDLAYAAADLVLCRSGAGTVSELAVLGLPAVYVPLPVGNGEQRLNAEPLVTAGGGLLVPDAELTPAWISAELIPLLHDEPRLKAMSAAAQLFGIRDADERLADLVISVARPA